MAYSLPEFSIRSVGKSNRKLSTQKVVHRAGFTSEENDKDDEHIETMGAVGPDEPTGYAAKPIQQ